jgi:hypothetical protein
MIWKREREEVERKWEQRMRRTRWRGFEVLLRNVSRRIVTFEGRL